MKLMLVEREEPGLDNLITDEVGRLVGHVTMRSTKGEDKRNRLELRVDLRSVEKPPAILLPRRKICL